MAALDQGPIDQFRFCRRRYGHSIEHLRTFRNVVSYNRPGKPVIYLAGDCTFDNKMYVSDADNGGAPYGTGIPEIYRHALRDIRPIRTDVAFWMNYLLGNDATCINAAVEASTLEDRKTNLYPQDEFIRGEITGKDILIVCVGAGDVFMYPKMTTMWHAFNLLWLTRKSSILNGTARSLRYFQRIFGHETEKYIKRLCSEEKPRAVIVCMIHFPLVKQPRVNERDFRDTSWSDRGLKYMRYHQNPGWLRLAIKKLCELGTAKVAVEGTQMIPFKLYEVLDGTRPEHYGERIVPRSAAGRLIAERLMEVVDLHSLISKAGLNWGGSSSSSSSTIGKS